MSKEHYFIVRISAIEGEDGTALEASLVNDMVDQRFSKVSVWDDDRGTWDKAHAHLEEHNAYVLMLTEALARMPKVFIQ